jgi:hypothetical protein
VPAIVPPDQFTVPSNVTLPVPLSVPEPLRFSEPKVDAASKSTVPPSSCRRGC